MSIEMKILLDCGCLWRKKLDSERVLKKHQYGGKIVIETPFFSSTLAGILFSFCDLASNPSLVGPGRLAFNALFGEGWFRTISENGETWLVDSLEMNYLASGKLRFTFNTLVKNVLGQVLTVT